MTSTRLPGKVVERVAGRLILEWVVQAVRATPGIAGVCVASPGGDIHEPVVAEALRTGAEVARGSETDLLERFAVAAAQVAADVILPVTTDRPLSDPSINGQVLALLQKESGDYACNIEPFGDPHGLECEVLTRAVLKLAHAEATEPYDREYVTPWIKRDSRV